MAMSASEVKSARAVYERLDDEHGLHLVEEIERLRGVLSIFALDANWRLNHRCDPNSSHFDGLAVAQKALEN